MKDEEIDAWLEMLGKTRHKRIAVVTDMLNHAATDQMSDVDRSICLRALGRLGSGYSRGGVLRNGNTTPRRFFHHGVY